MNYTTPILIMLLFLAGFHTHAQTTKPEKPTLYYVTVDPETGYDLIVWYATPSVGIADYYKVLESVTANPEEPPVMVEISAEIPITDTFYINMTTDSHYKSVGYSVVAINDLGGGPSTIFRSLYDEPDSTIYLEAVFDSCMASITLIWNDYNNWRGSIAEYNLYRRLGPGIYELMNTVTEGVNTLTLNNISVNQHYDLFIETVHTDGRRSTSNRTDVYTNMSQIPDFVNADYATIGEGSYIDLAFTIDGNSSLTNYVLMRSTNSSDGFNEIASFNTSDTYINYTDEIPFTSGIYYYRLDVMNNCNQVATSSNLANNIILNGSMTDMTVTLHWNEYVDWSGGVNHYQVIRTRGNNDEYTDTLDAGLNTSYSEDISLLTDSENPGSSLVCYRILAIENTNMLGNQGTSLSNRVCFSVNPDVRIPNAFIPNDSEPVNQVFEPVFSFQPEKFDMVIYNRMGLKVWEGSEAWDGRVNGSFVPEGVYLYHIRVFNYSTDIEEYSGKVTVVYR